MTMSIFFMKALIKKWKQYVHFSNNLVKNIWSFQDHSMILLPACKQY